MKNIQEHIEDRMIQESFKKIKSNSSFHDTYLIFEHACDGSKLTKNTFIEMMKEDIETVRKIYAKEMIPLVLKREQRDRENRIQWTLDHAKKYAEAKWKTDKRRQQHYIDELKAFEKTHNSLNIRDAFVNNYILYNFSDSNLTSSSISMDNLDFQLSYMWDKEHHIFETCGGWMFLIDTDKKDITRNFGIYIDVILDDESYKKRQDARRRSDAAVADYYASKGPGEYTGD